MIAADDDGPALAALAHWCADGGAEALGLRRRDEVVLILRDWLAAWAAGLQEPAADGIARASACLGTGTAAGAFRLGALSHLAEVDDGHGEAMIHPGVVTLPPLLALARSKPVRVAEFLAAVAAGYEAAVRVGAALGKDHYAGFHMTGTAGSFAAAATVCTVRRHDAATLLSAFGLAGTQAAGLWQFQQDAAEATKACHAGFAARNGIYAADLAGAGVQGPTRILEGSRGLAAATGVTLDQVPLLRPFDDTTAAILTRTVKAWPVCGQMFHILDVVSDAFPDPVPADRIAAIRIESFAAVSSVAGLRDPQTPAQGRFSTPFCVAHLLVKGHLEFGDLVPSALSDPRLRAVANRVEIVEDDKMTAVYPARRECRVHIMLTNNTKRLLAGAGRRGGPERPLTPIEFDTRFEKLTGHMDHSWHRAVEQLAERLRMAPFEDEIDTVLLRRLLQ